MLCGTCITTMLWNQTLALYMCMPVCASFRFIHIRSQPILTDPSFSLSVCVCVSLVLCTCRCVCLCVSTIFDSAKKRLRTMLKNPTKKANANALVAHLALIQRYSKEDEEQKPIYNPVIGDFVQVDVPDNVDETTMRKIKRVEEDYHDHEDDDDNDEHPDHDDNHDMDDATVLNLGFEGLSQDDKLMVQEV